MLSTVVECIVAVCIGDVYTVTVCIVAVCIALAVGTVLSEDTVLVVHTAQGSFVLVAFALFLEVEVDVDRGHSCGLAQLWAPF